MTEPLTASETPAPEAPEPINFKTFSIKYFWSQSASCGQNGEIPAIWIRENDPVPPLDKVAFLKVDFFSSNRPEESSLWLVWQTTTAIRFVMKVAANDARMKAQYVAHPEILEKVMGLLKEDELFSREPADRNAFTQEAKLSPEDIPAALQASVQQVEIWKVFVKGYERDFFISADQSYVTGEGEWYVVFVPGWRVRIPPTTEEEKIEDSLSREFHSTYGSFDRFDPGDKKPTVIGNGIYWRFPKEKVVVAVVHTQTTDAVAKHFGYADSLSDFRSRLEAAREAERGSREEYSKFRERPSQEFEDRLTHAFSDTSSSVSPDQPAEA